MYRLLFYSLSLLISLLVSEQAFAQRTSDKTFFFELSPIVSVYSIPSGGIALYTGEYVLNSYWKAGISAVNFNQKSTLAATSGEGPAFDSTHYRAEGGWMYRLWGSYSRSVSFYAGGSAFLGFRNSGPFRYLPSEMDASVPDTEFIYGIQPELAAEFFVSRNTAIVLGLQGPFTFGSSLSTDLWHLTGSLGIRINL